MDPSTLISTTFHLLNPFLQAGKKVITDNLEAGLQVVIPDLVGKVYGVIKGFFSKDESSKKMLEEVENEAQSDDDEAKQQSEGAFMLMLRTALKDPAVQAEVTALFEKFEAQTKTSVASAMPVTKNYTIKGSTITGSTVIQGDKNKIGGGWKN